MATALLLFISIGPYYIVLFIGRSMSKTSSTRNLIFTEIGMSVWKCACKIMRQPCCHNPKSKHAIEWADGGIKTTHLKEVACLGLLRLETKPTTATLHILIPHNLSFLLVLVSMETLESMLWHFWVNLHRWVFAHTYGTHFFLLFSSFAA